MFKYIRSRIPGHETRVRDRADFFKLTESVRHGFPAKATCVAYDADLNVLIIGTQNGDIRIYGAAGVELCSKHPDSVSVKQLFVLPNQGRVVSLCEDSSFHLWEINDRDNKSVLEHVRSIATDGRIKKIASCCVRDFPLESQCHILIGTEGGNVYQLDAATFDLTDHIIYHDVVIQNIPDDYKLNPGAVESLAVHPSDPHKLLIGYNRGLIVLWNGLICMSEQTCVCTQQVQSLSWQRGGERFMSAHNDGSYIVWDAADCSQPAHAPSTPYGPFPCKPISKILWRTIGDNGASTNDTLVAFAGGMPRAHHGDRKTVSVMRGDRHVALDFTSTVLDFLAIDSYASDSDIEDPHTLIVLCEEEIVAIDILSPNWPVIWRAPYLHALHASSVTAAAHVQGVDDAVFRRIVKAGRQQIEDDAAYSNREWPIQSGDCLNDASKPKDLLLTGHEDGSVKIWDASGASLSLLYVLSTAPLYADYVPPNQEDDEEDWPPFKKVGVYDPYTDDVRFSIQRLAMSASTGLLAVGAAAGQVMLWQLGEGQTDDAVVVEPIAVHIVSKDEENFTWKGQEALPPSPDPVVCSKHFSLKMYVQLYPPAATCALALSERWSLLGVGTAHGFALMDIGAEKEVFTRCTLSSNDVAASAAAASEGAISRLKSFKKSLRESFRKRKRTRQPAGGDSSAGPSTASPLRRPQPLPRGGADDYGSTVERVVEARGEGESAATTLNSVVRSLQFANAAVVNNLSVTRAFIAATNAGTVYIHVVGADEAGTKCTLAKEIQLRHKAPVMALSVIDSSGCVVDDSYTPAAPVSEAEVRATSPTSPDAPSSTPISPKSPPPDSAPHAVIDHRLFIVSEEQLKVFHLPTLKPERHKYKLTALEGSRVRKVVFANFSSRSDASRVEPFIVILTNQGEIQIFNHHARRYMHQQALRNDDLSGISSAVLTNHGQLFYLLSPSELQRITLTAASTVEARCRITLPEGSRPVPVSEERCASPPPGKCSTPLPGSMSLNDTSSTGAANTSGLSTDVTVDSIRDYTEQVSPSRQSGPGKVICTTVTTNTPEGETVTHIETHVATNGHATEHVMNGVAEGAAAESVMNELLNGLSNGLHVSEAEAVGDAASNSNSLSQTSPNNAASALKSKSGKSPVNGDAKLPTTPPQLSPA